jgi:hypothetical protein
LKEGNFDSQKTIQTLESNLELIHMNYGKEFKNLLQSTKVNAMYYDKIVAAMNPTNMTPYIIEERH